MAVTQNVPRGNSAINQRRVGTIAIRVAVLNDFLAVQAARTFQHGDNAFVGLFHMLTGEVRHFVRKLTGQRHRANQGVDAVGFEHAIIVFTESWRLMHQASTAIRADVVIADHNEGA